MDILLLCEGNARTFDSWSGISVNVLSQLEASGHTVMDVDCDLYGSTRRLAGALTFSTDRKRWWVKYHLGAPPFGLRTRRAAALSSRLPRRPDAILQFGATFAPPQLGSTPLFLYCDGNILLARAGIPGGESDAASLSEKEIDAVARRERAVYERAERIFCISERVARSFVDDFGIPAERVSTIYAGANLDDASKAAPDLALRRLGPPRILFVGRSFARKGGDVLFEAFRKVRKRMPEARLTVIGPTELPDTPDGVDFLGLLSREEEDEARLLRSAYERATVFCVPSRFEGLSISFLEAMFFALPCVSAAPAWAPPEMIVPGDTGLTVPIDDPDALAGALVELLEDQDRAERMGAAGRRRALDAFTWERVVGRMLDGMREALAR